MTTQFTSSFDEYACPGDTITADINGLTITARIEQDPDWHIDYDDAHNPDQNVTGCDDEGQARLLHARDAYYRNEWGYVGIALSATKNGVILDKYASSLWGIECNYPGTDNSYLTEVANELLDEAVNGYLQDYLNTP